MTNLGILSTEFQSWSDFTPHWWCSDLCYCPWQARFAGAQPQPSCKTVLCHLFGFCVRKRLHSATDPFCTDLLNNRFLKLIFSFTTMHCDTFTHNQSSVVSSAKPRVCRVRPNLTVCQALVGDCQVFYAGQIWVCGPLQQCLPKCSKVTWQAIKRWSLWEWLFHFFIHLLDNEPALGPLSEPTLMSSKYHLSMVLNMYLFFLVN